MVADHCCIRVFKETLALQAKGFIVDLVGRNLPHIGHNIYNSVSLVDNDEQLKSTIESSKADIFHVHNEPDDLVLITRSATDKPIVFDIHDLSSLRWGLGQEAEEQAFSASNAFIHVSDPIKTFADDLYKSDKPAIVVHSYVNERWLKEPIDVGFDTIVYEGALYSGHEMIPGYLPDPVVSGIRNLLELAEVIRDNGLMFHCYSADQMAGYEYQNREAVVFQQLPYPSLLNALRNYGMGFVGAFNSVPLQQAAMPNKLFEYISQGVVPLVFNSDEAAKFVEENNCGIKLNSLDELKEARSAAKEIRKNVLEIRHEITMEKHIDKVIDLYNQVL